MLKLKINTGYTDAELMAHAAQEMASRMDDVAFDDVWMEQQRRRLALTTGENLKFHAYMAWLSDVVMKRATVDAYEIDRLRAEGGV